MNTPHKWAEVIKAWADGAEVQHRPLGRSSDTWYGYEGCTGSPSWNSSVLEFRVKPQKKSPGEFLRRAMWPDVDFKKNPLSQSQEWYEEKALSIINAYKAGEIE